MTNTHLPNALPDWIADEKMLRDEAVLFGLSEARPDEKLAAIRLAFAVQTAPLEKQLEQAHETVGELNGWLETARQESTALKQQPNNVPKPPLGWTLLGLGLAVGLSVGLALLLQEPFARLPLLSLLLAGLLAVSGCTGTLLLAIRHHHAQLTHHQSRTTLQLATVRTLNQQIGDWQAQKRQQVAMLYAAEAQVTQLNATRDRLLRLFESEYALARSVRDRVNDQFMYNEQ